MISSTVNSRRTAIVAAAAAVALGAGSLTGVANAEAGPGEGTGSVSGISSNENSENGKDNPSGSVEKFFADPLVQSGGVLLLGLGVAAALAIGAGIQGGAFNDVQLPF